GQASDAAVAPVVLSFAAMYFAKQSFTSASMFVAGLVDCFAGAVLGCVFGAKRVQNSVEVRPEASMARRQGSDAAVPAVGLVLRAAYFVRQSLTRSSRFAVGLCGWVVGSVLGAKRAQNSADVRPEASIARRHASGAALPTGA